MDGKGDGEGDELEQGQLARGFFALGGVVGVERNIGETKEAARGACVLTGAAIGVGGVAVTRHF